MVSKPTVLITREIPAIATDLLKPHVQIEQWAHEAPMLPHVFIDKVKHVDAILSSITEHVTDDVLAVAGPQLKIVANYAVGFDNIDTAGWGARKIPACNVPDYGTTDANVSVRLVDQPFAATLRCEVSNIFNADYELFPNFPMPMRTFALKVLVDY